jgi:iron complex outermembrane receptor protein
LGFTMLAGLGLSAGGALAQAPVVPPQPAAAAGDDSGVKTVRTDNGDIIVTAHRFVPEGSVTATKTGIPLIQTPQSVTVITRDQIDLLNFVDLQQAVRYSAGVSGENYGPDPRYDFITVRGFIPKYYIDGLAVPATTTINSTGIDLYAFQSVDILKGPSSMLYGAAPPGGIVNEVSRRPSDKFSAEMEAKYGTHGFAELAGTVTGAVTPWLDLRLTGLLRDADSEVKHSNSKRAMIAPAATLKLGDRTRLTLLGVYQADKVSGGAGGFLPVYGTLLPNPNGRISPSTNLDDPADRFHRHQFALGYELEHRFSDALAFHSNTKWSRYHEATPIGLYPGGGFTNTTDPSNPDPDNLYFRTLQQDNFSYAETVSSFTTDNRLDGRFTTGALGHKALIGVDYRNVANVAKDNFIAAGTLDAYQPVYDPTFAQDIGYPFLFNNQRLKQTGIYGQDQISLGRLYVTLGGRYDWVSIANRADDTTEKAHKFTYRIGANYVTASGIAPYVSYATSFEPVLGSDIVTHQSFTPTSVRQWEGGVKYDGRTLGPGVKLFATAAAFDIRESNFVTTQVSATAPFGAAQQGGNVEVYGAELELVARIHEQLTINASYSYNHSEVKSSANAPQDVGSPLPVTPKHKASLFADYTLRSGALAGFGAGAGVRYTSRSAGGLPSTSSPIVYFGQAATLVDAMLHYDIPGWRFAVNASNLFNKTYVARCTGLYGCVYGAGREVVGTATKRF